MTSAATEFQWTNGVPFAGLHEANSVQELLELQNSLPSPTMPSPQSLVHHGPDGTAFEHTFENAAIEHVTHEGKSGSVTWAEDDIRLDFTSFRGYNTLHLASQNGRLGIIRMLLTSEFHLDVNSVTGDGHSALHLAALAENAGVVQELLRAGANALLRDKEGQTAIHMAAKSGSIAVARQILNECPECLTLRDNSMQTPLHQAVMHGHEELVKFFLARGADPAAIIC